MKITFQEKQMPKYLSTNQLRFTDGTSRLKTILMKGIKKLRNKLSSNTLSSEEEWFALRLLNFLVFKQINKLKLL